jgi:hypothetical protein
MTNTNTREIFPKTFEMGDPDSYVGNYEFQVPIIVLWASVFVRLKTPVLSASGWRKSTRRKSP